MHCLPNYHTLSRGCELGSRILELVAASLSMWDTPYMVSFCQKSSTEDPLPFTVSSYSLQATLLKPYSSTISQVLKLIFEFEPESNPCPLHTSGSTS